MNISLPYAGSYRYAGTVMKRDGILGAAGAANATTVTAPRVNDHFFIGGTVAHGAELADTHALAASVA